MPLNPPIEDWRGKTVWLVGASSGIGLATAHALHAEGARVVVSARDAGALDDFVAAHGGKGAGAVALPLDVTDGDAVCRAGQTVLAGGRLDAVVYCAGTYAPMRATAFDLPKLMQHLAVNYAGALQVIDAVLPHFLANRRGHISLIASVAGYGGLPQSLAYGPTKAALINLAETLYLDLHGEGIGVHLICPGFVKTPLTAQNGFKMPALITPEQAAQAMLRGWAAGDFETHFPKRFTRWMKALRLLPYSLYFRAVSRFTGL
ncbi:short-chain dehydrogenase [Rhodoferax koreense]|uniref:Short-chain dehydrogenase n=1 Tax=Rhodoferax koreensis TaxID=1842727 RepID=A0A1P8K2B6_9BURK|nr:SDR family NAD(P)-dependent oxidoreductase [Rhodoferax koreense]APW40153.1 short-chain dehydrogenase [Rhodoferax koreense]